MRRGITTIIVCVLVAAAAATVTPSANAVPRWAPASTATIHPGVETMTGPMRCIVNFVFYNSQHVYVGQAAHCSGKYAWGCRSTTTYGVGTRVRIQGASRPGRIVYNSWDTMADVGEQRAQACYGNDFALVQLDDADMRRVNPSVPLWGGPTGAGGRSSLGSPVYSYANSTLTGPTTPRVGVDTGAVYDGAGNALGWDTFRNPLAGPQRERGAWMHGIQWVPAWEWNSADRDVLGGVLDARGRALGVPSSWAYDLSNGVTDLSKAIAYMKAKTNLDAIKLANGTTPFAVPL
jgi:hypothetical protein